MWTDLPTDSTIFLIFQVWTVLNAVLLHHFWQDILQFISFRFSYELSILALYLPRDAL